MSAGPGLETFNMTAFPSGEFAVEPGPFFYPSYTALLMF
jgi:hypothetical protein